MQNLCNQAFCRIGTPLILLITLFYVPLSGQYDLMFQSEENHDGVFRAVAADSTGNVIAAGRVNDTVVLNPYMVTNTYAHLSFNNFVGKFNSVTQVWQWVKQITIIGTGSGSQFYPFSADINDVAMDGQGNSYITGYYVGTVKFDNISLSSTKSGSLYTMDIFVAKLNANGNFLWATSLGSKNGVDYADNIIIDPAGNSYISGVYTNKTLSCNGQQVGITDVFLAKLGSNGAAIWQKRYASSVISCANANNQGKGLGLDASGNICMAGTFSGSMSFGNGTGLTISSLNGTKDAFIAKINPAGTTLWVKSNGTPYYDNGNTVLADASGAIVLGGDYGSASLSASFVSRYHSNGTLLWTTSPFTLPLQNTYGSSISRMIDKGNKYVVTDQKFGFKTLSIDNGVVLSTDSLIGNGALPGGNHTGNFTITDVAPAGNDFVFSLGGLCGYVTVGSLTLQAQNNCPSNNPHNLFLVAGTETAPPQMAGPVFPQLPVTSSTQIEVYPNPASDFIQISFPGSEKEIVVVIQDQDGRSLWKEMIEPGRSTTTINLTHQHFDNGIYHILCLTGSEVKHERVVVSR
jgi:hypothetical protein